FSGRAKRARRWFYQLGVFPPLTLRPCFHTSAILFVVHRHLGCVSKASQIRVYDEAGNVIETHEHKAISENGEALQVKQKAAMLKPGGSFASRCCWGANSQRLCSGGIGTENNLLKAVRAIIPQFNKVFVRPRLVCSYRLRACLRMEDFGFKFSKRRQLLSACTTKRFPSPRCASATNIVRPFEPTLDTHPQLQPALLRLSAMISQYFTHQDSASFALY